MESKIVLLMDAEDSGYEVLGKGEMEMLVKDAKF